MLGSPSLEPPRDPVPADHAGKAFWWSTKHLWQRHADVRRHCTGAAGVTGELELALGLDHESEGGWVLPAVVGRSAEVGRRCLLRSSLSAERTCSADGGVVAPRW